MDIPHLVGTLAGDDTAFLAMKDNAAAERFCSEIEKLL
jgi:transcriptional regulator of arginine metabolism